MSRERCLRQRARGAPVRSYGDPGALCQAQRLATEGVLVGVIPHSPIAPQGSRASLEDFPPVTKKKVIY